MGASAFLLKVWHWGQTGCKQTWQKFFLPSRSFSLWLCLSVSGVWECVSSVSVSAAWCVKLVYRINFSLSSRMLNCTGIQANPFSFKLLLSQRTRYFSDPVTYRMSLRSRTQRHPVMSYGSWSDFNNMDVCSDHVVLGRTVQSDCLHVYGCC